MDNIIVGRGRRGETYTARLLSMRLAMTLESRVSCCVVPRDWEGCIWNELDCWGFRLKCYKGNVGLIENSSLKLHLPSRVHQSKKTLMCHLDLTS